MPHRFAAVASHGLEPRSQRRVPVTNPVTVFARFRPVKHAGNFRTGLRVMCANFFFNTDQQRHIMQHYKTQNVPTNTLRVGDLIIAHGGLFRVIQVNVSQGHGNLPASSGPCHVNYCEFIRNAFPGEECSIPKQWRDGRPAAQGRPEMDNYWNQQGNGLARTCRVTEIL